MNKHKKGKKFHREKNQRNALMKSQARSLIIHGKMTTTVTKAKALRPFVEKLITIGKKDTLPSRRLLEERLGARATAKVVYADIAPRYKTRAGGYTRIVKLPKKRTDGATMAIISFV
jgi:large subunit ribosomal protein L17